MTIGDVAKEAGVSISTVSQFMNKRYEYMSAETRTKIQEAVGRLNYRPNMLARSLKNKGTKTVGIIVANIMHTFTTQIIHHLEQHLQKQGFHVIVCNANDDPEIECEHIENLLARQVEGFILFPTGENITLYTRLYEERIPVVFMDRMVEHHEIPAVLLDNEQASAVAVEALHREGYTQLAIVTDSIDRPITPRLERLTGFEKKMTELALPYDEQQLIAANLIDIPNRLQQLFAQTPIDAIVAGNDRVLLTVLNSLPHPVGIAVIDDIPLAQFMSPAIITIAQPTEQMAKKAVEVFLHIKEYGYQNVLKQVYRFSPVLQQQ